MFKYHVQISVQFQGGGDTEGTQGVRDSSNLNLLSSLLSSPLFSTGDDSGGDDGGSDDGGDSADGDDSGAVTDPNGADDGGSSNRGDNTNFVGDVQCSVIGIQVQLRLGVGSGWLSKVRR